MFQGHRIRVQPPPGITAEPSILEGVVAAKSREPFEVTLKADPAQFAAGVRMIPFDMTIDDQHLGELFDILVQAKPDSARARRISMPGDETGTIIRYRFISTALTCIGLLSSPNLIIKPITLRLNQIDHLADVVTHVTGADEE